MMTAETLDHSEEFAILASGLSHQIRNRLNILRFNLLNVQDAVAKVAAANGVNGELVTLVHDIGDEVDGLEGITRDFLRLVCPDPPQVEHVRVGNLLESVARVLQEPCGSQNIQLSWDCPSEVSAEADPVHLNQVLVNLVLNAQQAMPRGGRVRLHGRLDRGHAVMEVADTGPGIEDTIRDEVFQPFFSTRKEQTGLGLNICQKLVEQMNGRLEFHTEVGQGTTFVVRLPGHNGSTAHGENSPRGGRGP
jgi:signal transduction histidine kinase